MREKLYLICGKLFEAIIFEKIVNIVLCHKLNKEMKTKYLSSNLWIHLNRESVLKCLTSREYNSFNWL